MTISIQSAGLAVQVALHSGDGQYTITGSPTSLFVVRQQAQGQQVIAYAFLHGTDINVGFQFQVEPTAESHSILQELAEALHAAHTMDNLAMPPEPTAMIQMMEQALFQIVSSLGSELS